MSPVIYQAAGTGMEHVQIEPVSETEGKQDDKPERKKKNKD